MGNTKLFFELDGDYEICPICKCECTHIDHVGTDDNFTSDNQSNVSIHFYGECGHEWIRVYSGHKGYVSRGLILKKFKFICTEGILGGEKEAETWYANGYNID